MPFGGTGIGDPQTPDGSLEERMLTTPLVEPEALGDRPHKGWSEPRHQHLRGNEPAAPPGRAARPRWEKPGLREDSGSFEVRQPNVVRTARPAGQCDCTVIQVLGAIQREQTRVSAADGRGEDRAHCAGPPSWCCPAPAWRGRRTAGTGVSRVSLRSWASHTRWSSWCRQARQAYRSESKPLERMEPIQVTSMSMRPHHSQHSPRAQSCQSHNARAAERPDLSKPPRRGSCAYSGGTPSLAPDLDSETLGQVLGASVRAFKIRLLHSPLVVKGWLGISKNSGSSAGCGTRISGQLGQLPWRSRPLKHKERHH